MKLVIFFFLIKGHFFIALRDRKGGGERNRERGRRQEEREERERNIYVREKY